MIISTIIHFYDKVKGPELTGEPISAAEQFEAGASHVTASAAAEGQRDVESAKAASASYIEQAKNLASDAIAAAQVSPYS